MVKTINLGIYEVLRKNEECSMYDILLCKECLCSCLRNNFSRHKKSPKHLEYLAKKAEKEKNFPPFETLIKEYPLCC